MVQPAAFNLRDMYQPISLAKKVYKRTKVDNFDHFTVIDLAFFRLGDDCIDHVIGFFDRLTVGRGNFDHALVVDIDLGSGHFYDFADHFTARSNDFADFVSWDVHGLNAGGMHAEISRLGQGFGHFT